MFTSVNESTKTCATCVFKSGTECTRQWGIPPSIDPVTGNKRKGHHFQCKTQRTHEYDSCGSSGKWWRPIREAKAPTKEGEHNDNIFSRTIKGLFNLFRD